MAILLALIGAIGAWLLVDGLWPRPIRVTLGAPDERPASQRLLETFVASAAERVMVIGGRVNLAQHKADLAQLLAQANYPQNLTTPEAVLANRLLMASVLALFGAIFGLLLDLGPVIAVTALGLGLLGWQLPDRVINGAIHERVEQLQLDAASVMDRLAVHTAAGTPLPMAIITIADRPGGEWVAVFRQIAAIYAAGYKKKISSGDFNSACDFAIQSSGRLPEIMRIVERLKAAGEMGGGTSAALRQMAQDARINARVVVAERGSRNTTLMILPGFFAILGAVIVLMGPGFATIVSAFMNG